PILAGVFVTMTETLYANAAMNMDDEKVGFINALKMPEVKNRDLNELQDAAKGEPKHARAAEATRSLEIINPFSYRRGNFNL
ncbi:hypothetical protein Q2366_26875, partial [Escherichia coli]|nr:hypothetical protein [Escherichia coli]